MNIHIDTPPSSQISLITSSAGMEAEHCGPVKQGDEAHYLILYNIGRGSNVKFV